MQLFGKRWLWLKVIVSWLLALGCLIVLLPVIPVTPGYLPDHME
jgi:hypothetical protein